MSYTVLGKRLTDLMNEKLLTQGQLAEYAHVRQSYISELINGNKRNPSCKVLISLARYFGVSIDYLLGLSDCRIQDINRLAEASYTGLSEKAIYNFKLLRNHEKEEISKWIENGFLDVLFDSMRVIKKDEYDDKEVFEILAAVCGSNVDRFLRRLYCGKYETENH